MKKRQGSATPVSKDRSLGTPAGVRDQGSVIDCPRFNQARMLIESGSL